MPRDICSREVCSVSKACRLKEWGTTELARLFQKAGVLEIKEDMRKAARKIRKEIVNAQVEDENLDLGVACLRGTNGFQPLPPPF